MTTVENSSKDGNTRSPDLPLEKSICRSVSNSYNDMEQQTGSKWEKEYVKAVSEKAMAPHSNTLAWEIPWTEEPGGVQSMGSQKSQT